MSETLQSIYFSRLIYKDNGSGLTNQIFSLVSSIMHAISLNKRAIAIDSFGLSYNSNERINISNIIDLKKTSAYLNDKYNIVLLDKNTMKFQLHKACYGIIGSMIDVTNEISHFISKEDNTLCIPQNTELNSLKGDPFPGKIKDFYIYYSLDNYNFFEKFAEKIKDGLLSNVSSNMCNYDLYISMGFIRSFSHIFNDILKNIVFIENNIPLLSIDTNIFNKFNKVNVIHLRLEDDALVHWSKQNMMTFQEFKVMLETKYIELIKKYIQKDELNIILSYSSQNSVFDFLQTNDYPFLCAKKDTTKCQRELDALGDLFLSTKCNNIFIGNFYMKIMTGSTFSYYILQKLEHPNIKKISICLDNIKEPEEEFY